MIKKISRSGHVEATKENGYKVQGQLSEELLQALFDFVEGLKSTRELADRLILENASEEQALFFIDMYPPWQNDKDYGIRGGIKDRVRDFDGKGVLRLYQIIIPHKSQLDWRPYMAPNLWLDLSHHEVKSTSKKWLEVTNGEDINVIGNLMNNGIGVAKVIFRHAPDYDLNTSSNFTSSSEDVLFIYQKPTDNGQYLFKGYTWLCIWLINGGYQAQIGLSYDSCRFRYMDNGGAWTPWTIWNANAS